MQSPGFIAPTGAASLMVAAGRFFHAECLDCPASADEAQRRQMAEVVVEDTAPLPVDQLQFGVVGAGPRTVAWVAVKKRLSPELPAGHEQADHLVPETTLPLPPVAEPAFAGWRWVSGVAGSLTALRIETGCELPVVGRGFAVGEGDTWAAVRERAARSLPGAHEPGWWRLVSVEFPPRGGAVFHWEHAGLATEGAESATTTLSAAALDLADCREPAVVAAVRERRRSAARLKQAGRALLYTLVALFLLQGVIGALGALSWWQETKLAETRPAAEKTEAESSLLSTLDRVTAKRLPALERLVAVNRTRPEGVVLTGCAFADSVVKLAGRAATMNELNEWIGALRKDPVFGSVETTRVHTSAAGTVFELKLTALPGGVK